MRKLFAVCMTVILCLQWSVVSSNAHGISCKQAEIPEEQKSNLQGDEDNLETDRTGIEVENEIGKKLNMVQEEGTELDERLSQNNKEPILLAGEPPVSVQTKNISNQQDYQLITLNDIQYDDRIPVEQILQEISSVTGTPWEVYITYGLSIVNQAPTSWQIERGKVTEKADINVFEIIKNGTPVFDSGVKFSVSDLINNQGKLCATGTGTATLCLTAPNGVDAVYANVTVSPAELTLMFISGQSNAEGWCSSNTGYQKQYSIASEEGTVYSTYVPSSNLSVANSITGLSFSGGCTVLNVEDYVPGALTGIGQDISISGKELQYKGNTLTTAGNGKTGMDSGLAYEWQTLTGDKVWVVNASWGGSSIMSWVPGGNLYERAESVYDLIYQTYCAEIEAGHYIAGDQLMFWLQGEQDKNMEISTYGKYFSEMYEGLVKDFSYLDGIGVITVRSSVGSYVEEEELQMTAPRVIQYAAGNSLDYEKLYVVSNSNEQWVNDEGVQSYFQGRYGSRIDAEDYPIRVSAATPVSMSQVHSDIHYSQLGHNENGLTAAEGLYCALYAEDLGVTPESVSWYGESGLAITEYEGLNQEDTVLIPVAYPVYTGKQMDITSIDVVSYDALLGIIPKGTITDGALCIRVGSNVIARLPIKITDYLDFSDIVGERYTGFYYCEDEKTWYYIENGKVDVNKTDIIQGTVNGENSWWYVKNGEVVFENTVAQNANGWWKIENGKVNFDFTGFAENQNGWWYLCDGKVQFEVTNVIQGTVMETTGWWYVENGKVSFTDTVAQNRNGWWYINNGKVDFSYYGVEQNKNGWWRIENGKVNFDFNGFAENRNGWWYLSEGKVQFDVTDVIQGSVKNESGWWYVNSGKVDFTKTIAKNRNGWWRIENGKVNFNFTGFAENQNGWWYVEGGKVQLNVVDVVQGTVNDTNGWWYVDEGKVAFVETVAKNSNGWWYIKDGKVDFSHYGVEQNRNGWWRIEAGKVNFSFYGIAENQNGWWYISAGKVDFNYNGTVVQSGITYTVVNGAVNL